MAVRHVKVSVSTSAIQIAGSGGSALISTLGGDVYIGGPGVTTTTYGYKLTSALPLAVDLGSTDNLYAIAASATDVAILYVGV